jgi:hypothetical protein
MKKTLALTLMMALVAGLGVFPAQGQFYVISVPAGVGTRIDSVPYQIKQPGFYYLGKNLTIVSPPSGPAGAITVECDNVTIDLMGFSIVLNGSRSGSGIYLLGDRKNVEIRNGTISRFETGITGGYAGTTSIRTINLRASYNNSGISLNGWGHVVKGCNFYANTFGIIFQHPGHMVKGCSFYQNTVGIQCSNSLLIHNIALGGTTTISGSGNTLVDNRGF